VDRCLRGKHDFGYTYGSRERQPVVDEFFRFKCLTCGIWTWRSDVAAIDPDWLRKQRRRVKWDTSKEQDRAARLCLATLKAEAAGVELKRVDSNLEAPSTGSPGVNSQGSPGVRSARSRGVRSGARRGGKAVRS